MKKLTTKLNQAIRKRVPDFTKYLTDGSLDKLGDYKIIDRSTLTKWSDIMALPHSLSSNLKINEPLYMGDGEENSMKYILMRINCAQVAYHDSTIETISKYAPIHKIKTFDNGDMICCLLLNSNTKVIEHSPISGSRIVNIFSEEPDDTVVLRYKITLLEGLDLTKGTFNVCTHNRKEEPEDILDKYSFLLYKRVVPESIKVTESKLDPLCGDISVGYYDLTKNQFVETETINISSYIIPTTDVFEQLILLLGMPKIDKDLLREKLTKNIDEYRGQ